MGSTTVRVLEDEAIKLGKVLEVHVGETPDIFFVHQKLICSNSKFFSNAMNGKWEESKNCIIRLPANQPATFNLYAQWLYTRRIPSGNSIFNSKTCEKEFRKLVDAYILGDQFQDTDFKNAVVDAFLYVGDMQDEEGSQFYPRGGCIKQLYEGTPGPCGFRRLLVDTFVQDGSYEFLEGCEPPEFFRDLAVAVLKALESRNVNLAGPSKGCLYHEREEASKES